MKTLLNIFLLFPLLLSSQTYNAKYKCIVKNHELLSQTKQIDSSIKSVLELAIEPYSTITYEITSNKQFIEIIGILETNEENNNALIQSNSTKFVIDLIKKIGYNFDEKKYFKIVTHQINQDVKADTLISTSNPILKSCVFSDKIPYYVTPFLIFENPNKGLLKIVTSKFTIELINSKKIESVIDYGYLFKDIVEPKDKIDFLQ